MKYLPNLLSASRVLMAPYVCWLILRHEDAAVLAWFAIAAATDALDGWAARWLKVESRVGQMLDPVADKVLMFGVFLALAMVGSIPWWLAGIVLGRDVVILGVAGGMLAMGAKRRSFPPSIWGKLSTVVQVLYVLAVVGANADFVGRGWAEVLGYGVVGLTAVSAGDYARRAM